MKKDALQTFKNIKSPTREKLVEILAVVCRKYVKPQSMATVTHKIQNLVFKPANQKLVDFLDDLQNLATNAFGVAAPAVIKQFIQIKKPSNLKKPKNQAHLKHGTYEQSVTNIKKELKLNGFEAFDELQKNTVSQNFTNKNTQKPKPTCHHCKNPGHYRNQCLQLKNKISSRKHSKWFWEQKLWGQQLYPKQDQ